MTIGAFAKRSGLTVETLRHYDRLGLLPPACVNTATGYRTYDAAQLREVSHILALKDAGFTLAEIVSIQAKAPGAAALIAILEQKAADMQQSLARQQKRVERLLSSIFLMKNGGIPMANEIIIKAVEPIAVCALRRKVAKADFDTALEEMWPLVNRHIEAVSAKRTLPCMMLYHNGTWTHIGNMLDIEVAEPITGPMQGAGDVRVYSLPAEKHMACVVHKGSFETITQAYCTLDVWLGQNGYTPRGPLREIYHVGDWMTENPEEYVTELQVPVE